MVDRSAVLFRTVFCVAVRVGGVERGFQNPPPGFRLCHALPLHAPSRVACSCSPLPVCRSWCHVRLCFWSCGGVGGSGVPQDYIQKNVTWWPAGAKLNLTAIPGVDAFTGLSGTTDYISNMKAAGTPPVGLIGPMSSESFIPIR